MVKIDCLISLIYANSLACSIFCTIPEKYIKKGLEKHNFNYEKLKRYWEIITPSNFQPVVPKEKILLMSGTYDKYVHFNHTGELWSWWGKPKRLVCNCGHSGLILKRNTIY